MEHSAVAYLANGDLIIAPVVRTTTGLGLEVEPKALGRSPEEVDIADKLAEALADSARVVPHPAQNEWKGFTEPFQKAAGVRSYKAFMKNAQRVSIRAIGSELKLTPQRNLGTREGFDSVLDQVAFVSRGDLKAAAATLLRMLGLSGS